MKAHGFSLSGLPGSGPPFFIRVLVFLFFLCGMGGTQGINAEDPKSSGKTPPGAAFPFNWDLLWTGSWNNSVKTPEGEWPSREDIFTGGTVFNRLDLSLNLPGPELSFRGLATDKRLLPPTEDDGKAGFNPAVGIYHTGSGSRFLYGVQSDYGLPARINNVWQRGVPYMESRSPSSRDLKHEPSARDKAQSYLYLALPYRFPFDAFASVALDDENNPAFGGGFGFGRSARTFRLEGFYTGKELPSRGASTWFSSTPPLPEREFNIYALTMIYNSPVFAAASDWALSETFAWGRGVYGNFALRLGNKPWRFSVTGDGAGDRFVDRSGAMTGAGFRFAAKGERFWTRSGLLRFQGTFRGPGIGEDFERGYLSVYFRPSAPSAAERRNASFPIRFSRASISLNRDARRPEKTADALDVQAAFVFGPINSVFTWSLDSLSVLDAEAGTPPLYQSRFFEEFVSYKISGELGIKPGIFDIKTRAGYTRRAEKESIWDLSFNISARPGKWGRLGLRIASTEFPKKWDYTFSWRFNVKK